ncbi:MAG: UvrD-helicase domain-containing protein [Candidatus Liptonbacteria bacterium]|nr:UvrD-helicase domain-containing protein [Candidatus Liptonbacteria bacterium]
MFKFDLNPQQKLAVQAADKPLLIVAGAGTGKTRTLTGRLAYLMEKGVPPGSIVAITFTNKAAKEMAGRISTYNPELITNNKKVISYRLSVMSPFIGTFHSFGARILRAEAKLAGRNSNFVIFDDSDSLQVIKKILKTESAKGGYSECSGAADLSRKISQIKNGVSTKEEILTSFEEGELILKVYNRYEKELEKNNAFDFDDLIEKVVTIFEANPKILEKYRRRFNHLLVDEYQDLNNKQYRFIKLMVGDSSHISVVGDDQQMIYSFRGSNFRIFLDFERDWPDANIVLLEENYRSTSNIIRAASVLMSNNVNQKPKTLWTKKENGAPVKIVEAEDDEDEAYWIAEEIEKIKNHEKKADVAIIYRTNAQSRAIEQVLIERGIPYQIFGGLRFYERKEIKDIVAALRYVQNPNDEISRERLEKNIAKGRFAKFRESISGADISPEDLIGVFLESTGYLELMSRNSLNAEERSENIAELVHFASEFRDLSAFLEQIALLQPTDESANRKGQMANGKNGKFATSDMRYAVNLMTIHLAKGLEFDGVFIAGCNEGLLPHSRSMRSELEIEEERRLMYVAMTRAKKELFLSFYDIPSRLLGELPRDLIEFESLVSGEKDFFDIDSEERYITLD